MRILEAHSRVNSIEEINMQESFFDAFYVMGVYTPTEYSRQLNAVKGLDPSLFSIKSHFDLDIPKKNLKKLKRPVIVDFIVNHLGVQNPFEYGIPYDQYPNYQGLKYGTDRGSFWLDTLQLNYQNSRTLEHMVNEIVWLAHNFDGVRCDMAHLILPEIYESNHGIAVPKDIWPILIKEARAVNPDFLFIAETYGFGTHQHLIDLGFDYVYALYLSRDFTIDRIEEYKAKQHEILSRLIVPIDTHDDDFLSMDRNNFRKKLWLLSQFPNTLWYLPALNGQEARPSANCWKMGRECKEIHEVYENELKSCLIDGWLEN